MGIDIRSLPPSMQRQVLDKMSNREPAKTRKKNKLGNHKTVVQLPGEEAIEFDSKREAARYTELRAMEKAGKIINLRLQVPFVLIPKQYNEDGKCERNCKYIADFVYLTITPEKPEHDEDFYLKRPEYITADQYEKHGIDKDTVIEGECGAVGSIRYGYIRHKWSAWRVKQVVEDSKGYRDPSSAEYAKFVIKRKLMLYIHGITIREV